MTGQLIHTIYNFLKKKIPFAPNKRYLLPLPVLLLLVVVPLLLLLLLLPVLPRELLLLLLLILLLIIPLLLLLLLKFLFKPSWTSDRSSLTSNSIC